MKDEWAENRLADFNLWAAGSGAFAGQRASLDDRLAYEQDTKTLVVNMLTLLYSCISACCQTGMDHLPFLMALL